MARSMPGPGPWFALLGVATFGIATASGIAPSPFLPPLPDGVAPAGFLGALARAAGLDRVSPAAATLRGSVLMGIAVLAFLALALLAWRGRVPARAAVTWSLVLIAAVAILPPLLSRDVYSYAIYGRIWAVHGANPYVRVPLDYRSDPFVGVVSGEWIRARSVYGPAFTILSGGIARAFRSPAATVAAFKILAAAALGATVLIAARLGERVRPGGGAFAAVAIGLNPVVLFHTAGGAHNDVLVGLAVVAALAVLPRRPLAATAILTLGALVKLVGGVPLALAIGAVAVRAGPGLRARLRAVAPHVAIAAGITALLYLPFGYTDAPRSSFATLISRAGWASPAALITQKLQNLGAEIQGIDAAELFAAAAKAAFVGLGMAILLLILRRRRQNDPRVGPAESWGWGLLAVTLCGAYLLPWYAVWFLPALVLTSRPTPIAVGVAVSALLAVTGIPAEPMFEPATWGSMLLTVHYVVTPVMVGLLVALLLDLRRALLGRSGSADAPATDAT